MPNRNQHDVIIVGAGPAGALLGYWLSRNHLSTLIIEKKTFPRYKPCGGGLTRRALALLPFDISQAVEDCTIAARVSMLGEVLLEKHYDEPIITMVMRDKLDAMLVEKARQAGADFSDGTAFENAAQAGDTIVVDTTRGVYKTRVLVGADGVGSRVARSCGLRVNCKHMVAMEGELYPPDPLVLDAFRGAVHFDFGVLPAGYGWIFPKSDHLSAGVMSYLKKPKGVRRHLFAYLKAKGLPAEGALKILRGHRIPYGTGRKSSVAGSRSLLVGDAAGLADPITGEGIYFALRQAQIASRVIAGFFTGQYPSLKTYDRRIREEFIRDMICARRLGAFFYGFPKLSRGILKLRSNDLPESFLAVVSGSASYHQLFSLKAIGRKLMRRF